jgi:PAS domain S-box-containing protein
MLRLSLRPNVVAAYLSALMVCAMAALAYGSADRAAASSARSRSALVIANAVRTLDDRIRDANSAERDLVATGEPRYAGAYAAAADGASSALVNLRQVTARYPALESRVDSLGYFVGLRLAELNQTVRLRRDAGLKAATDVMMSQRGSESDLAIAELLGSISASVTRTDSGSAAGFRAESDIVLIAVGITAAFSILIAFFVNVMHARNVRAQRLMTRELEDQALQLQLQATELTAANRQLESTTSEMQRQSVEAERSETRLAGILGSATDAVVSFDDEERIVYFNAAARRLFGMDEIAIPGSPILRAIADRAVPVFEEHMLAARRSAHIGAASPEVWDTLVKRLGNDEEVVPVEVSMAYARTGKQGLFTAVLRDVSRQRQLEEEFRQAQKMEAVGRLAGGIAHDFNNLLTVIGASSDFLLHDLRDQSSSLSADVREIKAATNRAASLTRQLLAFSRRQLVQPQLLDINAVVIEMEVMLRRLIGEDMTLSIEYGADIGLVKLDLGQLEQIIVNLVVNARDAMPHGGTVRLCTAMTTGKGDEAPGEYVTLSVADSGTGMDENTRAHIFEPFFTTKEQGKGTGLGLSTVYGIVQAGGGDIEVDSEIGSGTEFRVRFPSVEEEEEPVAVDALTPDTARGYETVLVVEDEEPLRRLTRRILETRGYTVLDAPNGQEAIRVLASAQKRVDLLLTDVVMPGMSGRELVERLLPVYPWLRVLFMSGYTEDMMLQHRVAELGITVVEKPFTRDDLAIAVRNTLDRTADPAAIS